MIKVPTRVAIPSRSTYVRLAPSPVPGTVKSEVLDAALHRYRLGKLEAEKEPVEVPDGFGNDIEVSFGGR